MLALFLLYTLLSRILGHKMNAATARQYEAEIPSEATQQYIVEMLDELSVMARMSGLKEMASLLKATSAASRIDLHSEIDA